MRWTSINESGEWWEDNFCTEKIHTLICSVSSATVVPVALKPSMFVLVAFTLVMFDIILARAANFKVDIVSSKLSSWGEQATSSIVFVFPPSEFCNILVSLLSLYGIWAGLSSCTWGQPSHQVDSNMSGRRGCAVNLFECGQRGSSFSSFVGLGTSDVAARTEGQKGLHRWGGWSKINFGYTIIFHFLRQTEQGFI